MDRLEAIEKIRNVFDFGYLKAFLHNSIRARFEMGFMEFFKHLFWGSGYLELTPPQLETMGPGIPDSELLVIDLRERIKFESVHIEGAVSHPFDEFLKAILLDGRYTDDREKRIVLVCDTGHKSRVAASILAEAGFSRVFSLNRGMHRFFRWQDLKKIKAASMDKCCPIFG